MSRSKVVYPFEDHHRLLLSHGLIDFAYSKRIGDKKKQIIKETYRKFGQIVKHKEDFSWGQVTSYQAKELERAGYTVKGNWVFVRKRGAKKITIKNDSVIYDFPDRKETRYLAQGVNWEKTIDRLLKKKLKPNEMLGLSVGDNSPFNTRFSSLKDAIGYVNNVLKLKEGFEKRYITLVQIKARKKYPQWQDDGEEAEE